MPARSQATGNFSGDEYRTALRELECENARLRTVIVAQQATIERLRADLARDHRKFYRDNDERSTP